MRKWFKLALLFMFLGSPVVYSQNIAVKTNILYDATTTFNLGAEFPVARQWTMEWSASYNPWTFSDNKKWKHWMLQGGARYWFCQRLNGHFVGFHAMGGEYNMGNVDLNLKFLGTNFKDMKEHRYEGWSVGGGFSYGYSWLLSRHWNIEAEIGIGYLYTRYDKYTCVKCGDKLETKGHNYIGPTKAAINLIYVF